MTEVQAGETTEQTGQWAQQIADSGKDKEDEVRRVKKTEKMGPTIAYRLYLDF